MEIVYLLVPLSVVLALLIIGIFAWAIHAGQFEDIEREGLRILDPEADVSPVGQAGHREHGGRVDTDQSSA